LKKRIPKDVLKRHEIVLKKRKAQEDWVAKYDHRYEGALRTIKESQRRHLQLREILLIAILGGIFVNLFASGIVLELTATDALIQRAHFIIISTVVALLLIFLFVMARQSAYWPIVVPNFVLAFNSDDWPNFMKNGNSQKIQKYMSTIGIEKFEEFGKAFFKIFDGWIPYIFKDKRPTVASDYKKKNPLDPTGDFPILVCEYDISQTCDDLVERLSGKRMSVQSKLDVFLEPVFYIGNGLKTTFDFKIILRIRVLNPNQPMADYFLEVFKTFYLHQFPSYLGLTIQNLFEEVLRNPNTRIFARN